LDVILSGANIVKTFPEDGSTAPSIDHLQPQIAQTGMIVGTAAQRPVKQTRLFLDRQIVDAGKAPLHETLSVELPVFVAVSVEPLAGIVAPFVSDVSTLNRTHS